MHYDFGNYLYFLRSEAHLTQKELAARLSVSDKAVSKWENGSSLPQSAKLKEIAAFFRVSTDELLTGGKSAPQSNDEASAPSPAGNAYLPHEKIKAKRGVTMNLIPQKSKENFDYVCTWALQDKTARALHLPGDDGCTLQRDALNDKTLFGDTNFYHVVPEEYRPGLFFLLDDGWDVPYGTVNADGALCPFGSCSLDDEKFPHYGKTPAEKLKTLSDKIKALGYAGLGLWIPTQTYFETTRKPSFEEAREYWTERAIWSEYAGIRYWKIDWGFHCDIEYRSMMTEVLRKNAPHVIVEHAFCQAPYTQMGNRDERVALSPKLIEIGDVFRLYDVMKPFKHSSMLSRIEDALSAPITQKYDTVGILNAETCSAICAALGLATGLMGYSSGDEAVLRWHRVAPPFSIYDSNFKKSELHLTDTTYFDYNPDWWIRVKGQSMSETAPAVMSRGCDLPTVKAKGLVPFVCASRNALTGAYTIAALPRTIDPNVNLIAPADIEFHIEDISAPIGIFGYYDSLTLRFDAPVKGKIVAQDMLGDESRDITDRVKIDGDRLILSGALLREIGKSARDASDTSEPSLVLQIVE